MKEHCDNYFNCTKAELPLEGISLALNFLPWEFLLVKQLEIEKLRLLSFKSYILFRRS